MSLKFSKNLQENACSRVSFLIKLQAEVSNFIKKETLALVFSCEFWEISNDTFFIEHLRWLLLMGLVQMSAALLYYKLLQIGAAITYWDNYYNSVYNNHIIKNVRFWSYSCPYFPAFGLNTERYRVSTCNINYRH